MNLKKIKKSFFATSLATLVALAPSLTTFAAPISGGTVEDGAIVDQTTGDTKQDNTSSEPETFGEREYYFSDELPNDIVAVNRVLDSEVYGNESYFMSVTDLGAEKLYYDTTDNLSFGENNHLSESEATAQKTGEDVITLSGGETLRITIFYRNDNGCAVHTKLYMGSFFPDSLQRGEVKTIWAEVYLEEPAYDSLTRKTIDRGYNVVPLTAEEDVILEYVEDSLVRYDYDETLNDARVLGIDKEADFFIEDPDEIGMPLLFGSDFYPKDTDPSYRMPFFYPGETPTDPSVALSGYVSYKVKVTKAPGIASTAAEKAKEKFSNVSNSEAFSKYNDFMTNLGQNWGNGLKDVVDSFKN